MAKVNPGGDFMSDEVSYRLAREEDYPIAMKFYSLLNKHFQKTGYLLPSPENIGQLWLDSFVRTLGRFSIMYVAEGEGRVVGFILARIKRLPPYMGGVMVGELSDMWIEEEYRRLGIGKQLSVLCLDWLKEQKVHSVEIQVLVGNDASWKLYENFGFVLDYRHARLML
jgi:ribosomal protein S18 acetylase RimI-like enzyme